MYLLDPSILAHKEPRFYSLLSIHYVNKMFILGKCSVEIKDISQLFSLTIDNKHYCIYISVKIYKYICIIKSFEWDY